MTYDFRLGRWQEREAETVDCMIFDAPYSSRTHTGNNSGRRKEYGLTVPGKSTAAKPLRQLDYAHLTPAQVRGIVRALAPINRGWWVSMTDHTLFPAWAKALESAGLYVFAPVPCVIPGMTCRLTGDGPSSWAVYLCVARPRTREFANWGTLPGAYIASSESFARRDSRNGGKPLSLMSQIVRDYSREGDTVYDPFAGHATTGVAALQLGRHFVGDECDATAHAAGLARLQRVVAQPSLFEARTKTGELFSEAE